MSQTHRAIMAMFSAIQVVIWSLLTIQSQSWFTSLLLGMWIMFLFVWLVKLSVNNQSSSDNKYRSEEQ